MAKLINKKGSQYESPFFFKKPRRPEAMVKSNQNNDAFVSNQNFTGRPAYILEMFSKSNTTISKRILMTTE